VKLIDYAGLAAMVIISASVMIGAMWLSAKMPRAPRDHLCQIAEISPDITTKERERCRQLKAK